MPITKIDQYQIIYSSNRFSPRIGLFSDGKHIGQLVFHPAGTALPPDGLMGDHPSLHYHIEHYPNALDLLRNNPSVWFLYKGGGGGFENALTTDPQAFGEHGARFAVFPR